MLLWSGQHQCRPLIPGLTHWKDIIYGKRRRALRNITQFLYQRRSTWQEPLRFILRTSIAHLYASVPAPAGREKRCAGFRLITKTCVQQVMRKLAAIYLNERPDRFC